MSDDEFTPKRQRAFIESILRNLERAPFPVARESTTSVPSQLAEVIRGEFGN